MDSFGFPTNSKSQQTGRVGEAQFEHFVKVTLGWDYRRVPQESDYGIDAYIDIFEGSNATGLSIAVQIKCGASYLKNQTPGGVKHEGETKHLNYYLHNKGPILLVVLSPDMSEAYWEFFSLEKTSPLGKTGWWIEIPKKNKLDASVLSRWRAVAGPLTDHTEIIQRFWRIEKLVADAGLIIFAIPRSEVNACSMETVNLVFNKLCKNTELLVEKRLSIEIYFPDYIDDPRELYEIPEVRKWFWASIFLEGIPWFYFLNAEKKNAGLRLLLLCSVNIDIEGKKGGQVFTTFQPNAPASRNWVQKNFENLNVFTEKYSLPEDINKETSLRPLRALGLIP